MEFAAPALSDVDLDRVLRALADPQRRRVIVELVADPNDDERACSSFDLPVAKSTRTHHWRTLREAGLVTQRDAGNGTYVRLRRAEFDKRFPGLLDTLAGLHLTEAITERVSPRPGGSRAAASSLRRSRSR